MPSLMAGASLNRQSRSRSMVKGAIAGAAGGLLGAAAMSGFATARARVFGDGRLSRSKLTHLEASRYVSGSDLELDSIALAADRIDRATGRKMSPGQKSIAAAGVHFGLGALLGAVYGVIAESSDVITRLHGMGFAVAEGGGGNLVWTAATGTTRQYSAADHAESVADHAVYGAVLETVRGLIRGRSNAG